MSGRRVSWVAAFWLACQSLALIAPLAIGLSATGSEACTCPSGVECPMHHSTRNSAPTNDCRLRNSCVPDDVALTGLAAGLGILPEPAVIVLDRIENVVPSVTTAFPVRFELPDSPPPRA